MSEHHTELASITEREIVSTRVFNTPRDLIFKAWTDPNHLAQWWGPKGFTNTFHKFDLRPGGAWEFTMHGPNGVDFENKHIFAEILPTERIVLDHVSEPHFQLTATFEDRDGQTLLTFRMLFDSAEVCEDVKVFAVPGNEQNFDRLETELAKM